MGDQWHMAPDGWVQLLALKPRATVSDSGCQSGDAAQVLCRKQQRATHWLWRRGGGPRHGRPPDWRAGERRWPLHRQLCAHAHQQLVTVA